MGKDLLCSRMGYQSLRRVRKAPVWGEGQSCRKCLRLSGMGRASEPGREQQESWGVVIYGGLVTSNQKASLFTIGN